MRLAAGVLALTLFASLVHAEDARPAEPARPSADATHGKIPLRVVRVMPESGQALLFDRVRSTHVLAEVGGKVAGYTVESIDDDEVTLRLEGKLIVLVAPARGDADPRADQPVRVRSAAPMPLDPYGEPAIRTVEAPSDAKPATHSAEAPIDPYADPPIRSVEAPGAPAGAAAAPRAIEAGEGGVRVVRAPGGAGGAAGAPGAAGPPAVVPGEGGVRVVRAPDAPSAGTDAPAPATRGAAVPPVRSASAAPGTSNPTDAVLSRGEVATALADFARLSAAVRASFTADGVLVSEVSDGTIFARAGLRAGDVVTAVDGARLRTLDDAANLYVRASTAKAMTAQVVRAGKPITLHVAIQ